MIVPRLAAAVLLCLAGLPPLSAAETTYDIVVYGGTSGGVAAAIQAAKLNKSVLLIEPSQHLGGLTTGGLGATDIGNKAVIGGLAREFYRRIGRHYAQDGAWKFERRDDYQSRRKTPNEPEMWTFEPHVALAVYRAWLAEQRIEPVMGVALESVAQKDGRIAAILLQNGRTVAGRMFIDATYEGDLLAAAGVKFHVGREANATYGETLNGVQTANAVHHQFVNNVDPYVKPGDPASGLLPLIQPGGPGADGTGDDRVQTYNIRLCTTDVPENRRAWPKPEGYDERTFELLLRNFEAGDHRVPWNPVWMPNRKTDTNNNFAISTDFIGANYDYPAGDAAARATIFSEHKRYTQGLLYTLANHPRVPEKVRAEFQRLGLAKDEFVETDNWPPQLYVREARRMVSEYVMTQHHCQGKTVADDPVGMGAYNMDSHNCQRYVTAEGFVRNEGDIQVGVDPYPISFRSIRPRKEECPNLLVPVCLAASHIAYGSIRMEPVFMVLGQSAATAAAQAIDAGVAVQELDYAKLRERLLADGQVLAYAGPRRQAGRIDPQSLPGVVVDNPAARLAGDWLPSEAIGGFVGANYLHDNNEAKGRKLAAFRLTVTDAGDYAVRVAYTANPNRATNVPVSVTVGEKTTNEQLNQREPPEKDGFRTVTTVHCDAGATITVRIGTAGTDGYVIVDAVQAILK